MTTKKKRIVFIINPVSGVRSKNRLKKIIHKKLDPTQFDYRIIYTEYPHHATEIAQNEANAGTDVVVAVGGDGSANDVASGLVNTNTVMGLIPVGSGNGLAHHLRIPLSFTRSVEIINRFHTKRIDTATLNGKLFVSIAGVGFDALVAEQFDGRKIRGFLPYLLIIIKNFFSYKPKNYRIFLENKTLECKAFLISFANSDQFGFNASIAPDARIYDGYLELCILYPVPIYKAPRMANKLFLKNINRSKYVEIYKFKKARIETDVPVACQIDGDPAERIQIAEIDVLPKSLSIIAPYKKRKAQTYLRFWRKELKMQQPITSMLHE